MSRTAAAGAAVFVVAGLAGCAGPAQVVRQDANSVVIAVPDDTNVWPFFYRDAADRAAAQHIPDPVWTGTRRLEVARPTMGPADAAGGPRSFGDVITSTTLTDGPERYEYHLEYRCKGSGPVTPPPPGSPAASLAPVPAGDTPKPAVIPPILPVAAPASPAASLPSTVLPGPGR